MEDGGNRTVTLTIVVRPRDQSLIVSVAVDGTLEDLRNEIRIACAGDITNRVVTVDGEPIPVGPLGNAVFTGEIVLQEVHDELAEGAGAVHAQLQEVPDEPEAGAGAGHAPLQEVHEELAEGAGAVPVQLQEIPDEPAAAAVIQAGEAEGGAVAVLPQPAFDGPNAAINELAQMGVHIDEYGSNRYLIRDGQLVEGNGHLQNGNLADDGI